MSETNVVTAYQRKGCRILEEGSPEWEEAMTIRREEVRIENRQDMKIFFGSIGGYILLCSLLYLVFGILPYIKG